MTTYTFAEVPGCIEKYQRRLKAVVQGAANDVVASIPIEPGINRSGSRIKGSVPRDTGILANSLQSSLNGGGGLSGASSYALVVGQMAVGDIASFEWGAEYARFVHDGANGVEGTFWIQEAATGWQDIVAKNVKRAEAIG